MMELSNYIYYRIYGFFLSRKDNVPETTGWMLLSLMQFLTIVDIIFIMELIYSFPIPSKYGFLPLLIVLGVFNWYRYEHKFQIESFDEQWKDEEEKKKIRNGWLIGMYLLISLLFPVVLGILDHNLGMI
ncbi:hypothetical protein SAMN05661096_00413 [Marivirga sericea]|uniref:Uncharacterized protein n=1 Tax=Marivirga sericea TaxID=1028 RepID=A0A1X7IAP2_9BACT|nr:hypothetical protein [Marivirga sericea]SMG11504.1 hypothetical protein SAMN05661096_00413 [Marivirga sericea]